MTERTQTGPAPWRGRSPGCSRARTSGWSRPVTSRPEAGVAAPIPDELHPQVREALERAGITSLYSHQADAWESVMRRGHTIVTTGTASGKSLCFNLPVLHMLSLRPARPRPLPVPDQGARAGPGARASRSCARRRCATRSTTATRRRRSAPRSASARTSCSPTPTCCTSGSCPTTRAWGDFLANLALVVVDEAHVYRGVFGSHVANVLRRLRRLAEAYGTDAALRAHLGDDRQPARARRGAHRAGIPPGRPRRRPARRARDRDVQPAAARRAHRPARVQPQRGGGRCSPTWSRPACGRSASRAAAAAPS